MIITHGEMILPCVYLKPVNSICNLGRFDVAFSVGPSKDIFKPWFVIWIFDELQLVFDQNKTYCYPGDNWYSFIRRHSCVKCSILKGKHMLCARLPLKNLLHQVCNYHRAQESLLVRYSGMWLISTLTPWLIPPSYHVISGQAADCSSNWQTGSILFWVTPIDANNFSPNIF